MDKGTKIKREIKIGQIYRKKDLPEWRKHECNLFVISHIKYTSCCIIYADGTVDFESKTWIKEDCEFIAEYQTWQEAVNSKEFK